MAGLTHLGPESGEHLRIDYRATEFINPEQVNFRYRLKGRSVHWTDAGTQDSVRFFDLAPGDYEFEVEAVNRNLAAGTVPARFSFRIPPRFHQTLWFQTLTGIMLMTVVYGIHCLRLQRQRKVYSIQEQIRMEAGRRRIAQDMHDEIGTQFAQLKILGELIQSGRLKGAAVTDSIKKMILLASEGTQSLREILWTMETAHDDVDSLGDFLGFTMENMLMGTEIELDYSHSWENEPENLNPRFKRELVLITKGIVCNVIRHSQATRFKCVLRGNRSSLQLEWADNGVGYEPNEIRSDTLGLTAIRDRIERWGGRFIPITRHGKGVALQVTLDAEFDTRSHP